MTLPTKWTQRLILNNIAVALGEARIIPLPLDLVTVVVDHGAT